MPHENPFIATSGAGSVKSRINTEITPCENKNREQQRMPTSEKVNNRGSTDSSNSKVPIPEHIHDVNAKTFYKLGQFLGKVNNISL